MLPIKLDLNTQLAIKLRTLRLNTPVNGETLTAENLSKAIGNNRAWMSQIESRRLKKIKREDIIAIYKLLFNLSSDEEAEMKAEMDLLDFIAPSKKRKYIIGSEHVANTYPNMRKHEESLDELDSVYKNSCKEIYDLLLEYYQNASGVEEQKKLVYSSQKLKRTLSNGNSDSLELLSDIPIDLYKYANDIEQNDIYSKLQLLTAALEKQQSKKMIVNYNNSIDYIGKELRNKSVFGISIDNFIVATFLELAHIIFKPSTISDTTKTTCINKFINILKTYSIEHKIDFTLNELTPEATDVDFKKCLNDMQSFINGLKDSSMYFLHQMSDFFDNP